MVKKPRIVIIGTGSLSFGLKCIRDAFYTRDLWGSQLALVDLDKASQEDVAKAVERINEELGAGYKISYTENRSEALPGADFVITSIAVNKNELWKHDFLVPKKYGINHVFGETPARLLIFIIHLWKFTSLIFRNSQSDQLYAGSFKIQL